MTAPVIRVPLTQVVVSAAQRAAVDRVLDSGWLSMGPETSACEAEWVSRSGASHALLTANGTASLWMALAAIGVGPGDEVLVPSITFVADANVVVNCGATPVITDIVDKRRPVIDPVDAAARRTERTRAVIAVHYGGYAADLSALRAALPGVAIVEDAAHCAGPLGDGSWPGAGGEAEVSCYSFFANKNLGVGEGGLVTTADVELAARLKLIRSHGMDSLTWDRHRGHAASYDVLLPGMNFRPSEMVAALVRAGLTGLRSENQRRRDHLAAYRRDLDAIAVPMVFAADDDTTGHLAVIDAGERRDEVRHALIERGIQSSVHYPPIHRFSWYADAERRRGLDVAPRPRSDVAGEALVTLPLWGGMTPTQRDEVVEAVASVLCAPS